MTEQKPPMVYNNPRFRVVDYNFDITAVRLTERCWL